MSIVHALARQHSTLVRRSSEHNYFVMNLINTYTTDWIGSTPVFYNTKTKHVGVSMIEVIDWNDFEFDPEGLYNYLFFGYQVFEQTPVKHVRFLRHSSILKQYRDENDRLQLVIEESDDPIEAYAGKRSTVDEALELLKLHVRTFEDRLHGEKKKKRFLLPLSGGYDSRLLAALIEDKSRIDAFTYDISLSGQYSFEVRRAQEVCRRLGIAWSQVTVNKYWNTDYISKNFNAFCLEMPVHAAYHMEMYDGIIHERGNDYIALSGSVGDWWSGQKVPLDVPKDLHNFDSLFFNHGISIPSEFIRVRTEHEIKRKIYDDNIRRIQEDQLFRIVFARRGRIGLASYIYRTAEIYFETYTPFYDLDVAMSQLNLPEERRRERVWLRDYFMQNDLGVEQDRTKRLVVSNDYGLDIKTAYYSLEEKDLLHEKFFENIVDERRIRWINEHLMRIRRMPFPLLAGMSRMLFGFDTGAHRFGINTIFGPGFDYVYRKLFRTPDIFKAISEWTVLKPIELALVKAGTR